ncbi:MAG: sugar phosphate isomerase/epimerase [Treponema sp.]|jgi:sugar phosphate isomerase/epimerase|nr:sugar phosphate isomerase/epimerase [Treponema sp.]
MKIGVITDCFRLPLEDSLRKAAELGFSGVQIYAAQGEFDPSLLDRREELASRLALIKDLGLSVSALCGDMGGHGFENRRDNGERIEKTKRIIDLAAAVGTRVVTTHIGVIPEDEASPKFSALLEALDALGSYGMGRGVTLAIETGPEKPETLKKFIDRTHGGVGVNLDPANFVMVTGVDPAAAAEILGKYIVHTHVKDGIMKQQTDPGIVYNFFAEGGIGDFRMADYFTETPVGEGAVDFDAYLGALKKTGYDGFFTIEREAGADPEQDIAGALRFITDKLGRAGYRE